MFDVSLDAITALTSVILIDIVLAGDNAIAVGMAANGLPASQRGKVILVGIAAATILRIGFALIASQLMAIIGLLLAGGILLLWVSWKLWRELHASSRAAEHEGELVLEGAPTADAPTKTFGQATIQIIAADVSMSLDNVLAVAGAAHDHPRILALGLILSVALMGAAAVVIAKLLDRFRWIAYVGLIVILIVAVRMIWDGGLDVFSHLNGG
ncbi:MAG: YjbE family putative metal transport protein [Alphaproteobacteria bacterium]